MTKVQISRIIYVGEDSFHNKKPISSIPPANTNLSQEVIFLLKDAKAPLISIAEFVSGITYAKIVQDGSYLIISRKKYWKLVLDQKEPQNVDLSRKIEVHDGDKIYYLYPAN